MYQVRPGAQLIGVKRAWVPLWLLHKTFLLLVKCPRLRWILWKEVKS